MKYWMKQITSINHVFKKLQFDFYLWQPNLGWLIKTNPFSVVVNHSNSNSWGLVSEPQIILWNQTSASQTKLFK